MRFDDRRPRGEPVQLHEVRERARAERHRAGRARDRRDVHRVIEVGVSDEIASARSMWRATASADDATRRRNSTSASDTRVTYGSIHNTTPSYARRNPAGPSEVSDSPRESCAIGHQFRRSPTQKAADHLHLLGLNAQNLRQHVAVGGDRLRRFVECHFCVGAFAVPGRDRGVQFDRVVHFRRGYVGLVDFRRRRGESRRRVAPLRFDLLQVLLRQIVRDVRRLRLVFDAH